MLLAVFNGARTVTAILQFLGKRVEGVIGEEAYGEVVGLVGVVWSVVPRVVDEVMSRLGLKGI